MLGSVCVNKPLLDAVPPSLREIASGAMAGNLADRLDEEPESLFREIARRRDDWSETLRPGSAFATWLVGLVAQMTLRLDLCVRLADALRDERRYRAEYCWEEDRRRDADALGATLARSKTPALIVRKLRSSRQGALWLVTQWRELAHVLETVGAWDDTQRSVAADLLGIAPTFRATDPRLSADVETLKALVQEEIEAIDSYRARVLDRLDEDNRIRARDGLSLDKSEDARALRREETQCRRLLQWALRMLQSLQAPSAAERTSPASPTPRPLPLVSDARSRTTPVESKPTTAPLPPNSGPERSETSERSVRPTPNAPAMPMPTLGRRARRALEKQARLAARARRRLEARPS